MENATKQKIQLAAFVGLTLALFFAMAYALGFWGKTRRVEYGVLLSDAAGVVANNAVKIAGVEVGRVAKIGVEGDRARLLLRVDPEVILFANSHAQVRAKSLLGEKYIQLNPGNDSAARLLPGQDIVQSASSFEIDELLNSIESLVQQKSPLSQRLVSVLKSVDEILSPVQDPKVKAELQQDLEALRSLLRDLAVIGNSTRKLIESREQELGEGLDHLIALAKDRRLDRILSRTDRIVAVADQNIPPLFSASQDAVNTSRDLLQRVNLTFDDRRSAQVKSIVSDLADITKRGRSLAKDVSALQAQLKKGPVRRREIGIIAYQIRKIITRAAAIDEVVLRRFLQDQGVKIYLGSGRSARGRLEQLPQ